MAARYAASEYPGSAEFPNGPTGRKRGIPFGNSSLHRGLGVSPMCIELAWASRPCISTWPGRLAHVYRRGRGVSPMVNETERFADRKMGRARQARRSPIHSHSPLSVARKWPKSGVLGRKFARPGGGVSLVGPIDSVSRRAATFDIQTSRFFAAGKDSHGLAETTSIGNWQAPLGEHASY